MSSKSFAFRLTLRVLPILIAIVLLVGTKSAEFYLMPVVKDFHLTSIQREDDKIIMSGYMRKVRDCRFVGVSAAGVTTDALIDLPLKFLDPSKTSDTSTRPTGTQDWGPWRIILPIQPQVIAVELESVHSCHIAWPSTTRLARVPIVDEVRGEK